MPAVPTSYAPGKVCHIERAHLWHPVVGDQEVVTVGMKCLPGGRTVFGEVHPVLAAINREIDLDHIAMGGKQIGGATTPV